MVRRTVGWRSFSKRFLMNRKSSLGHPGVDGTGVEGRGVSVERLRLEPQGRSRCGGGLRNACGWNRKVGPGKGGPPTPVPFTPGYSELLRFIKNRSCEERRPTVRRTSRVESNKKDPNKQQLWSLLFSIMHGGLGLLASASLE